MHTDSHAAQIISPLCLRHSRFSLAIYKSGSGTAILQTSDTEDSLRTHRDTQSNINIVQVGNKTHIHYSHTAYTSIIDIYIDIRSQHLSILSIHISAPAYYNYQPYFNDDLNTLIKQP